MRHWNLVCLLLFLKLVILAEAQAGTMERLRFERELMGTKFKVVCYAEDRLKAKAAVEDAFRVAENIERKASDYLPNSEVSKLADAEANVPITVSELLFGILDHSLNMAKATDGAFDPTLGSLTKIWRKTREIKKLPSEEVLKNARSCVGWKNLGLDHQKLTVEFYRDGIRLDLGGVAKGYAADLMFGTMLQHGFRQVMVAAGGDIRVGDAPPNREGWRIALQTHDRDKADEVVVLVNAAISTSGDLYQWIEIDGIRYSHILDPKTGLGLTNRVAAVVIADEAKLSDPLATACCVMDSHRVSIVEKISGVHEVRLRHPQETFRLDREYHSSQP